LLPFVIKMGDVRIGDILLSRFPATMLSSRPMAMQVAGGAVRSRKTADAIAGNYRQRCGGRRRVRATPVIVAGRR
jgi:hypothetical protein